MNDIKSGNIQVSGLAELEKRMQELPLKIHKNVLSGMVRAGAAVVRDEARVKVPVSKIPHLLKSYRSKLFRNYKDDRMRTWVLPGNLKRSIRITKVRVPKNSTTVEYHVKASGKLSYYWLFIEFGTSKMAANSFLRPAFEGKKVEAVERMLDYGVVRIEKEATKR